MLTPEKPPIAEHRIWAELSPYWNLQPGSKNQRRFPLHPLTDSLELETLDVKVLCVCGEQFFPFRDGSMFFTAPGHRSCAATPTASHWVLWAKLEIGKLTGVVVQGGLYD